MKTRRNLLALLLALAMTFALAACGGDSQNSPSPDPAGSASLDPEPTGSGSTGDYGQFTTLEEGKLIMVTNASFPPYEMTDDDNNVIGIDPEIAQAIANKLGLELVIDNIDFDVALLAVQENRADVMLAGLTYREDRDLVMDFTDSYATGVQVIIVREGDATIQGTNENLQLVGADGAVLEDKIGRAHV